MNCTEFESAIELAVEVRKPITNIDLQHILTCDTCRRTWKLHKRLDAAIEAWLATRPPAGLADEVLMGLRTPAQIDDSDLFDLISTAEDFEKIQSTNVIDRPLVVKSDLRRKTRSTSLALVSPVACLFVMVVFMCFLTGKKSAQPLNDMMNAGIIPPGNFAVAGSPPDVSTTITDVLTDLRLEYDGVASETKSAAIEVVNSIPSRTFTQPDSDEIESNLNNETTAQTWYPISSRVKVAMGFLWRAVPSSDQSD